MDDTFTIIGNYIALSGGIPLLVFILLYFFRSPWRGRINEYGIWETNELGVALMAQKIAFLSIFIVIGLSLFLHDYPGRGYIRVLIYGAVVFFLWLDVRNLLGYQRRDRTKKTPKR